MPSPNLAVTHVAAAQNQKEVTINDAVDALDLAMTDSLAVDFSGGAVTLTNALFRRAVSFRPAAALSAPATLAVPQVRRVFVVINTDANYAIEVTRGTTGVTVPPDTAVTMCTDGSPNGLFPAGGGASDDVAVYDFGMVEPDNPDPGAVMGKVVIPRAITIPAGFAGSVGHVDVPPDASLWEISVTRNSIEIGTVTINDAGVFAFATAGGNPVAVSTGDVIRFIADPQDDPPETSIAGIALTIAAELA